MGNVSFFGGWSWIIWLIIIGIFIWIFCGGFSRCHGPYYGPYHGGCYY